MLSEAESRLEPTQLFGRSSPSSARSRACRGGSAQIADRLETGTLKVGIEPTGLDELEHSLRSLANRLGAALIVVGLLISSALMARVDHTVALVGFLLASALGLYMLWRILRTPGDL